MIKQACLSQFRATYESWNNIALTKGGQNSPIYKSTIYNLYVSYKGDRSIKRSLPKHVNQSFNTFSGLVFSDKCRKKVFF